MSLVGQFYIIVDERAEEIVEDIYTTMLANAPVYTGAVMRSINIQHTGKYRWFIGPHTDHDWYAEKGNHANRGDGYIHPVHAKALAFRTKYGEKVIAKKVRPHKGSKFVEKTANRFR